MLEEKILACLERIAFNTARPALEFHEYLEKVLYANFVPTRVAPSEPTKVTVSRQKEGVKK